MSQGASVLFNNIGGSVRVQTAAGPKLYHFLRFNLNVVMNLPVLEEDGLHVGS